MLQIFTLRTPNMLFDTFPTLVVDQRKPLSSYEAPCSQYANIGYFEQVFNDIALILALISLFFIFYNFQMKF